MSQLVEEGLLPHHLRDYRHNYLVTWDIETLESRVNRQKTERLHIDAQQYIASIGVATNLPNRSDKWFCRAVSYFLISKD